jgi:hypothetical protein
LFKTKQPTLRDCYHERIVNQKGQASQADLVSVYTGWRKEYLRNLRENAQVNSKRQKTEHLKEGDIVIVKNDKTNRNFWRLGKIEELTSGDGMVRAVKAKIERVKKVYPTSSASRS